MAKRFRVEYINREPPEEYVRAEMYAYNSAMIDFYDPSRLNVMGPVLSVNVAIVARIERVEVNTRLLRETAANDEEEDDSEV